MDSDEPSGSLRPGRPQLRLVPPEPAEATGEVSGIAPGPSKSAVGQSAGHLRAVQSAPSTTSLRDAYVFGARMLLDQPAACRSGYRLFWVHGRDLGWIDLEASSSVFAVMGWHENCDLVLPRLPSVTNRHLLASCALLADKTPALRLLDLHTNQPFTIEGQPRQSIGVSGPLLIGLGDCAIGCVPLPEFLSQRGRLADAVELPSYDFVEAEQPPQNSLRMQRRTHITLLPRSQRVEDLQSGPAVPAAPAGRARVTLRRQTKAVSVELSEADLYAGVIIGRSETCMDRGLRQVLSGQISRLHILHMAERGRVYAMDLCSTNGTWQHGQRIRRVELPDQGTQLLLSGNDSKVELTWHPRNTIRSTRADAPSLSPDKLR